MSVLRLLLVWGLVLLCPVPAAWGQGTAREAPVEILTYYGPGQSRVGAVENFRVRINETSARPVAYLWDFGDGTLSQGSLVAHRYQSPGTYSVVVIAQNEAGSDTLRASIRILPAPATAETSPEASREDRSPSGSSRRSTSAERSRRAPAPTSSSAPASTYLQGGDGVAAETSGFSWVLASDLSKEQLNESELRYRLQGYRVDVVEDRAGLGSPIYRLLLGHFPTIDAAMAARSQLPPEATHPLLYALSPDAEAAALAWAEQNGHAVGGTDRPTTVDEPETIASTASDPVPPEASAEGETAAKDTGSASTAAAAELQQVREAASGMLSREVLLRVGFSVAGLLCAGFLWWQRRRVGTGIRRVGTGVRRFVRGAGSLLRRSWTSEPSGDEAMAVDVEPFRAVSESVRLGGGAYAVTSGSASVPAPPEESQEESEPGPALEERASLGAAPKRGPNDEATASEPAPVPPPPHPHLQGGSEEAGDDPIEILWPDDADDDDPFSILDDWTDPASTSPPPKPSPSESNAAEDR